MKVDFSKPPKSAKSLEYITDAIQTGKLSGDGPYSKACEKLLHTLCGGHAVFITPSCTGALEMAVLLTGIQPGDEVIVPSFTFTSTANAVAHFGGTPVFVDIEADYLNLDPRRMAEAIGPKTKAVVPVHYAGVSCDMAAVMDLAKSARLTVIEDAAQCIGAKYNGKYLGTLGRFGALSFHETKNLGCGEGGAIFVRDGADLAASEMAREKGTDRKNFLRGMVDKYTWTTRGSSYLLSEVSSALLLSQLEELAGINSRRMKIWKFYHQAAQSSPAIGRVARACQIPSYADHNAHIFYLLMHAKDQRDRALAALRERQIFATSHYEPLHLSPAGKKFGKVNGPMTNTESLSQRLLRLPLFADMDMTQAEHVISVFEDVVKKL